MLYDMQFIYIFQLIVSIKVRFADLLELQRIRKKSQAFAFGNKEEENVKTTSPEKGINGLQPKKTLKKIHTQAYCVA